MQRSQWYIGGTLIFMSGGLVSALLWCWARALPLVDPARWMITAVLCALMIVPLLGLLDYWGWRKRL